MTKFVYKCLSAVGVIVVALGLASTASAAPRHYYPKPHAACRAHYVRRTIRIREHRHGKVVRIKRVECVAIKAKTKTTAPRTVRYAAVDPSFTQSPSDPLSVDYSYSASATSTTAGITTNLATTAALPSGILNLYSPTSPGQPAGLICSMSVGNAVTAGTCPVVYSAAGSYPVTVEYVPDGVAAVTQTTVETISPFSTTTTDSVNRTGCTTAPYGSTETTYSCAYNLTATVTDENGNAVNQVAAFRFDDGQGDTTTLTPASGQSACSAVVTETTYTGSEDTPVHSSGGQDPYVSSRISSSNCDGGNLFAGDVVPSWSLVAAFAGTPAYTASSSSAQTVAAF